MSILLEQPFKTASNGKHPSRKIPAYLVRETIGDVPFFFPDYRAVLNKTKTLDEVMADSSLQWTLKESVGDLIKSNLDLKRYKFGRGEVGVHLGRNENVGLDMAVFDRKKLTPDKIGVKYVDVPPVLVVEIDIRIEHADRHANLFEDYVVPKIRRLLEFGVERVLWIFSKSKTVLIAEAGKKWYFEPWEHEVELIFGIKMNVQKILEQEGFA